MPGTQGTRFVQHSLQRFAAIGGVKKSIRREEAPLLAVLEFSGGGDEAGDLATQRRRAFAVEVAGEIEQIPCLPAVTVLEKAAQDGSPFGQIEGTQKDELQM